jgi:hypothetical protein
MHSAVSDCAEMTMRQVVVVGQRCFEALDVIASFGFRGVPILS